MTLIVCTAQYSALFACVRERSRVHVLRRTKHVRGARNKQSIKMSVKVEFLADIFPGDPSERPCTILGKKTNLISVTYAKVLPYFGDKVAEKVCGCVVVVALMINNYIATFQGVMIILYQFTAIRCY